jgi:hypothetical protein
MKFKAGDDIIDSNLDQGTRGVILSVENGNEYLVKWNSRKKLYQYNYLAIDAVFILNVKMKRDKTLKELLYVTN